MATDKLTEKTLSSEMIYDGKIVHLSVDTVQLPNGQTTRREVVRHSGAVAIVPLDAEGNVILVRQYRHAANRILLEIPAGTLNKDEDPDVCAVRELQEEIGYKPGKLEKIGAIFVAPGYTSEFIHLYLATDLSESRLELDEDEFIEVSRVPFQEAITLIHVGEIIDGKSVSALLLAKEQLHL
ncbi:MAG: NUDIX hydrolase [Chloroflexota bacterium]